MQREMTGRGSERKPRAKSGNKQIDRDRSPSVSDIRKIFQGQMATETIKGKKSNSKGHSSSSPPTTRAASSKKTFDASEEGNSAIEDNVFNVGNDDNHDKQRATDLTLNKEAVITDNSDQNNGVNLEKDANAESAINDQSSDAKAKKKAIVHVSSAVQTDPDKLQASMLKDLGELKTTVNKLSATIYSPKTGVEDQLVKTIERVDNLFSDIHSASDGLKLQMAQQKLALDEASAKIALYQSNNDKLIQMLEDSKRLVQEMTIMQGILQKHSQKLSVADHRLIDLTKRGMEQNLILHGVEDLPADDDVESLSNNARNKLATLRFLQQYFSAEIVLEEIWKAHRTGAPKPGKVRPMVVKVAYRVKELVMENLSKIKGLKNSLEQTLFVSEQIPEGFSETKKKLSQDLKNLHDENKKKPVSERRNITVNNDRIVIDGEIHQELVTTPQPKDLFLNQAEQLKVNEIRATFAYTEETIVMNSMFSGIAVKVHSIEEVNRAYRAVAQQFSAMDHIMLAYSLKESGEIRRGTCEDGEFGAARRMSSVLAENHARNCAIFIVRQYGGLHLGFGRFQAIDSITKQALDLLPK